MMEEKQEKVAGESTALSSDVKEGFNYLPVQLTEALSLRDVCSEAGTIFEISEDQNASKEQRHNEGNCFDDEALINSLSHDSAMFDEEETSCSDDEAEPFEKLARKMVDMTGDGGVLKMEIRPGIGGGIPSKASVTFHYNCYIQFVDEPFDSSFLRNKPEKKVVDSGDMLPGLNIAIKTMRKNETSRFLIRSQYAFKEVGCPPRIPGNETILYEIYVVNCVDCAAADAYDDLDELQQNTATFQEKLNAARGFHQKGNYHYHAGNLVAAKNAYSRAAWIMKDARLNDEKEEAQRGSLLVKMHSNLAQVYIDLKEPAQACSQCKQGLNVRGVQLDDITAKIHFRFGKAKAMLHDFNGAHKEYLFALHLKPNNTDISTELEHLSQKKQKYEAQERFLYKRMFKSYKCTTAKDKSNVTNIKGLKGSKKQKDTSHNNVLHGIRPEFEQIVEERISSFVANPSVSELPFPSNISQADIACVAAAAKAANCSISVKYKGADTFLKVLKKK
ncbi:inactive peptidyl-prolyl cis-trans isomerase FKBP6 [Panulirus ornatus]|uniref:inactive peptidyl-prolyl cis-trans isomerase FKBP6 n=1 Tax=Panulirus ornatus TaxID=150431 RepID=UPI003A89BBE9